MSEDLLKMINKILTDSESPRSAETSQKYRDLVTAPDGT